MLNSKMFSLIDTFFNKSAQVESLEVGALKFGGATQYHNGIYSNYYDSDLIEVNKDKNTLSIFIPSTINYDEKIDNNKYVNKYLNYIVFRYGIDDISIFNTQGSYLVEETENIIKEEITIISLNLKEVKKDDIDFFLIIADMVKNEMVQYGVSVQINNCLAIV